MIYRVNNVEIDTSNFQLTENGAPISVEPKVFDLIVYMVTNRNRLITRQELFDNIWPGRIVSDTSLSNHIKSARKALGDDGQKQRVIKTVHGRGYQFVAETESLTEPVNTPDVSQTPTAPGDRKSIAVLAFSDLSPERDQEYFSDGLSEELINLLAKVPELRVISRTSAFSFKGKDTTAEEIGRLLNVTHLLEGSVRKAGNQLRITAQLVQVSDESPLWSETFDREMKNVFEIQDDIAHAVLDQLKLNLFNESVKSTPVNPDAYTLFLEARFLSEQHTADSNAKAEKVIRDSISLDPDYAPAWDLLGHVIYAATTNYLLVAAEEGLEEAAAAIQRSIDIDPEYAPAYASRAILNVSNWEFEEARKNIEKAMLLDRNNSIILNIAALVAKELGRIEESFPLLQRAIKLDPLRYVLYFNLGIHYFVTNRLDEAVSAIRKFEYYHPGAAIQHHVMTKILIDQGKLDEALDEAEREPDPLWKLLARNLALFALGKRREADALLTEFIDKYGDISPADVAYLYAFRNEQDQAFEWLDISFQQRDPSMTEIINNRVFSTLWGDSRWHDFLSKLGLPQDHWLICGEHQSE